MVSLNEERTISQSPDSVWPLLRDPAVVASCIPGAELSADPDDGIWRGSLRVKFGPTVASFRGEATLHFDDEARRVTIDGRGIDGRGASRALANSVLELHGEHTTTIKVAGEFTVTGPLETFVNAGGVHVARELLTEFCSNIAAAAAAGQSASPEAPAAPTEAQSDPTVATTPSDQAPTPSEPARAAATELSATDLIWRAMRGWVKNRFGKG